MMDELDILFLENVTTKNHLFTVRLNHTEECLHIDLYNSKNEKMVEHCTKHCDKALIKNNTNTFKLNFDSSKITIHYGQRIVFQWEADKLSRVQHVGIKPQVVTSISFKNSYTYLAVIDRVCKDEEEPILKCNLDIINEDDLPRNKTNGLILRTDLYKSDANNTDNYEIKIIVKNATESYFSIVKNSQRQLEADAFNLLGKKINLTLDIKHHYTSIDRGNLLFLWSEEDIVYNFEKFNRLILQNSKSTGSSFSNVNNQNYCELRCFNKEKPGFFSKVGKFFGSGFKVDKYCEHDHSTPHHH
jgi:hypothetical protein